MKNNKIKFRAWDKEGYIQRIGLFDEESTPVFYQCMYYNVQILCGGCEDEYIPTYCSFGDLLEDERYIVMQFTGLKDKNGVDIYEGDILQWWQGCVKCVFDVHWGNSGWSVFQDFMKIDTPNENDVEIIGNIYETPGLL